MRPALLHNRRFLQTLGQRMTVIRICFLLGVWALRSGRKLAEGSQDESQKRRLLLHVGPMKTGTTSLQYDLHYYLGPFLELDNWHYIEWDDPVNNIAMNANELSDIARQFKEGIDAHRGKNVIFSREQWSDFASSHPGLYPALYEALSPEWEVDIVAGYRPYSEWVASQWFQDHAGIIDEEIDWRDGDGNIQNKIHRVDGRYEEWFALENQPSKGDRRFTQAILEQASNYFSVQILDIDNPMGIRSLLLCDIITNAPHACEESLEMDQRSKERHNQNHLEQFRMAEIGLAAASKGLINLDDYKRSDLLQCLQLFLKDELHQSILDLPFSCPEDAWYESLHDLAMTFDRQCVPELFSEGREKTLRERLQRKMDKKAFCVVNANLFLQQSFHAVQFMEFYGSHCTQLSRHDLS